MSLEDFAILSTTQSVINYMTMVAYFCHHLSDFYVDLSDFYVDLSDLCVDLSRIHLLENESKKRFLAQLMTYR